MGTIEIKGKKNGESETVTITVCRDGTDEFLFDGDFNMSHEYEFRSVLAEHHPVGGTYFPDEGSALYYLAAMHYYFDTVTSLKVEGIDVETIPSEEGVVY